MNTKLFLAAIGGAVASFLLGWLVFGMLLADFFKTNTIVYEGLTKEPPVLWAVFLGGLCSTTLLAWIFSKMGITSFMKGATTALWIGFLLTAWYYLSMYAFMNLFTSKLMLTELVVESLFTAVIGGIVGAILGMGKKPVTTTA